MTTTERNHATDWHRRDLIRVAYGCALAPDQRGRSGVVTRVDEENDRVEVQIVTYLWLSPTDLERR